MIIKGDLNKLGQAKSQKVAITISSKSIDYLTKNFDIEKFEAVRILKKNEGNLEKALEQLLLGKDCLGQPEYQF